MSHRPGSLGRVFFWRLEVCRPVGLFGPLTAGLCGLAASGGMGWNVHTLLVAMLLCLLVEPLLGGMWDMVFSLPTNGAPANSVDGGRPSPLSLPYMRAGSAADRILSRLADAQGRGAQPAAFLFSLAGALAVAAALGHVVLVVAAAVIVLFLRLVWSDGPLAWLLGGLYHISLPWLMGMMALGELVERGVQLYWPALVAMAVYTLAYAACLALADGVRLPALLFLDLSQAAVVGLLFARQETLAVWLVGLCLAAQLIEHPRFLTGGQGTAYVRRVALYLLIGMAAAAASLAPTLAG